MKEIIGTPDAPKAVGPYSQAIKAVGETMLFCSGQIPIDPAGGQIIEGTADVQARQVMKNLQAVIEAAGFGMEDIVKTTIYLVDMSGFAEVNKVYESFFQSNFPARSTVEVRALPHGAAVEIEAIACK
ncbi:MAG: RidA family protein [Syntrophorhabdaceae bacterium]